MRMNWCTYNINISHINDINILLANFENWFGNKNISTPLKRNKKTTGK
jgi:hypothetical protein